MKKLPLPETFNVNGVTVKGTDLVDWCFKRIPATDVLKIKNVEERRIAMLAWGGEEEQAVNKFIADLVAEGSAELVLTPVNEEDYQFAKIWQIEIDGQGYKMIELVNRTLEPHVKDKALERVGDDGYKRYFIGIDPAQMYNTVYDAWVTLGGYKPQEGVTIRNKKDAYCALLYTNLRKFDPKITWKKVCSTVSKYDIDMVES